MIDIFERDRSGEMVSPEDSGYDALAGIEVVPVDQNFGKDSLEALAAATGVDTKGSWENPME